MSRTNNLYDLHKKREIIITQDYKKAILEYEGFDGSCVKKDRDKGTYKYRLDRIPGNISIHYDSRNILRLEITLDLPSLNNLWQIAMILAYFLGDGITVYRYMDGLPYYPAPCALNLGGGSCSFFARSVFARDPKVAIQVSFDLLNDAESLFRRLLVPMLQINTVDYFDLRFFGEFVLLESLSKKQQKNSLIINKDDSDVSTLEVRSILDLAQNSIRKSESLNEEQKRQLVRKLEFSELNTKGSTKDKIFSFVQGLEPRFAEYTKDVSSWNKLRNKGIAHGASLSSTHMKINDTDMRCMQRLHDFLCELLYRDFKRQLLTVSDSETTIL